MANLSIFIPIVSVQPYSQVTTTIVLRLGHRLLPYSGNWVILVASIGLVSCITYFFYVIEI
jgi:hypothetical protein